ncbi:hypothetical protein [Photobacterium halotolerans]|nr:hypothetical protein [Photobacterium halotolerans]NAW87162.1 hypothetical protein [Photobacterium halotolerans]
MPFVIPVAVGLLGFVSGVFASDKLSELTKWLIFAAVLWFLLKQIK